MGILWKLMGHSYGYNLFTGLAEAVPAALLFWRRTTTVGALHEILVTLQQRKS